MIKLSYHESERIEYLNSYEILDTPNEENFDELASLAADICEVPIAIISFVDKDRLWFKSKIGISVNQTERDLSFCEHTISCDEDLFLVEDASKDERFFQNLHVKGENGLLFYAGAPLKNGNNMPLGALCVLDLRPRKLTLRQQHLLKAISKIVMNLLEARKNKIQQEKIQKELKQAYLELEFSKTVIEKKNEDIFKSLTYAKRIQEAILPDRSLINEVFPNSFLFYRPKDVISGDFYWFQKVNGFVFGAVADCTGHGVPGALISMIGCNGLNRVIKIMGILEPSNILDKLNEFVIDILKENEKLDSITDGMDVALFRYNPSNNELVFSGANRPILLLIDGEISELRPNKSGIGGTTLRHPSFQRFNSVTLQLKKGDRFYIFTDGVTDQFNKDGKKILSKRLKESLLFGNTGEIYNQKRLLKELFLKWRGDEEQTDDVLFMGFEIPEMKNYKTLNVYKDQKTDVTTFFE